jgi:hypothetical protein
MNITAEYAATIAHGKKYGYSIQNAPPKTAGKCSCGRDKDPPIKGLHSFENWYGQKLRPDLPNGHTNIACYSHESESLNNIRGVRYFADCALYHTCFPVE